MSDTINNFFIDTEQGLLIESENYTSYTFKVFRTNGSSFLLENLVISKEKNKDYETYLYQYNITQQELDLINQNVSINLSNKISRITLENSNLPTDILNKEDYNGMCFIETTTYTPGQNCPNDHSWEYILGGGSCIYLGAINGPLPGTYTTSATLQPCPTTGGTSSTSSSSTTSSSYSGVTGGTGTITNTVTTSPVNSCKTCIPAYAPTPCDKVKNQFTNNPTLQDKLNTLSSNTALTSERGFHKLSNSSMIQNAAVGTNGAVKMPDVPNGAKCTILAHTHNSPATDTYSIFSWVDLASFAQLLKEGKLDANNFTAFLATADGTYYALTIENTQNFLQFFALGGDPLYNQNIALKRVEQAKLYYGELASFNENIAPIIDVNTDPINDEKAFLDLLQDNNLGVSLFESNATFTTFEKVTHNKTTGNIDKTPCN